MIELVAALAGLVVHEFAHAWVADEIGDPLPWVQGRLTLNPLAHLDPLWSVALPVALYLVGVVPVGKGRTIELTRADVAVFAAGPVANLVLAGLLAPMWWEGAVVNLALAGFNLLPLPGLDGGRIISHWRSHGRRQR